MTHLQCISSLFTQVIYSKEIFIFSELSKLLYLQSFVLFKKLIAFELRNFKKSIAMICLLFRV